MDVERIQKINAMALELMKQGLATDREDAVNQAERIFKAKGSTEYSGIRDTMQKVDQEAHPDVPRGENGDISQNQLKEILEQNTKYVVRKLKEIEEKMAALEKEIASINNKLTYQRPVQSSQEPHRLGEIPANNTIQRGPDPVVSAANHPRTGNFNEAEVSIEKFFYMGRK
ncbi:MAG: hypothetical protein WCV90_05425 [Candidatus Woesearchaeota archaeon]|jgi:hypothetical protein